MTQGAIITIVVVIVGLGIAAALAYYIIRFMRGSIKLSLPRTAFNPGDAIAGSFDLQTKQAVGGNRLIVSLIGKRITKIRENGRTRTHTQEIYRDEVVMEDAKAYNPGYAATYEFELFAPNPNTPEFMNSHLGQTLGAAFSLLSGRTTALKWKLEARLDAKGVDLASSKSISINMR